jgi:hypothetical protein
MNCIPTMKTIYKGNVETEIISERIFNKSEVKSSLKQSCKRAELRPEVFIKYSFKLNLM